MALIGQAVSEKKIFENGGRRTDGRRTTDGQWTDGRTTEHGYTISSPCEPDGSGELKKLSFDDENLDGVKKDYYKSVILANLVFWYQYFAKVLAKEKW